MKHIRYLILGLLLASTDLVSAAEVLMRLNQERIDLLGSAFLEIVYVDMQGSPAALPSVEGLDIQYNGQSTQTQIINFKRSTRKTYRYLITPKRTGTFTIGPLELKTPTGSKRVQAELVVTASSDTEAHTPLSDLFYATMQCSQPTAYVYEPFECILEIYAAAHLETANEIAIRGGLPEQGLKHPLRWKQQAQVMVEIEGIRYIKRTFTAQATAIRAGRFLFEPQVQLSLIVPRESRQSYGRHDPFFGDFFGRTEQRPILLTCNSATLDATSLPKQNRPESFTGGVGDYTIKAQVSHDEIVVGDPITIRMTIEGRGHLDTLRAPEFPEHDLYKRYPPQTGESTEHSLVVEQTLMATSTKLQEIPALAFSFFDPTDQMYHTKKVGPFPLRVLPATLSQPPFISAPGAISDQENPSALLYLKPKPTSWNPPLIFTTKHILLLATPLLGGLIFWAMLTRRRTLHSGQKNKHSPSTQTLLKQAKKALQDDEPDMFTGTIHTLLKQSEKARPTQPQDALDYAEKREAHFNRLQDTLHAYRYGQRSLSLEEMQALLRDCESLLHERGQNDG